MKQKKRLKYTPDLPGRMYLFFISFEDRGAPSFLKFARSIGATCPDLERFRKHKRFDLAYGECQRMRRDYLIDRALDRRFDPSFVKFLLSAEGDGAEQDMVVETGYKFIEHIQFMKEFAISAEMMEDANYGIAADAKHRAENFARAYYKTINKICEKALICGTTLRGDYAGAIINCTTADTLPLFNSSHSWGTDLGNNGKQSNFFWGDIFGKTVNGTREYSTEVFEEALYKLTAKMRNFLDENGEPLGYTADTLIIPGNNAKLESIVKKVCGTNGTLGSNYNDINLHYGNWNIVVLPSWQPADMRVMVMSSEANKNLQGNMFFNRVPLTVTSWVDNHTGNYMWNGRCRFGVGFGTYKHILLAVDSESAITDSSALG